MFILSSISSGLEIWSVKQLELKVFRNIRFLGEISNNRIKN